MHMKKFLALYLAPTASFEQAMQGTPEDMKEGMAVWNTWMSENKKAIVDDGAPLGKTKKVTPEGASDFKNNIGGYMVVQAESFDDATKLFEDHPHYLIEGGWIEIME